MPPKTQCHMALFSGMSRVERRICYNISVCTRDITKQEEGWLPPENFSCWVALFFLNISPFLPWQNSFLTHHLCKLKMPCAMVTNLFQTPSAQKKKMSYNEWSFIILFLHWLTILYRRSFLCIFFSSFDLKTELLSWANPLWAWENRSWFYGWRGRLVKR